LRLALREMRRRPGRFVVATVILTLIAMLLMFLGGLLDGLTAGSTGALRAQQDELIVYSANSRDSLVRSRITPDVRDAVEGVVGPERVAGLGSVQLGARTKGAGPRDLVSVVLFGYERAPRGLPDAVPEAGRVYADDSLRADGVRAGSVLRLGPARSPVRVIGFLEDSRYLGQGSLWGSLDTWRSVLAANRPGERVGDGVVQALVVSGTGADAQATAEAVDRATGGVTSTLTIAQAIDALPGVAQQRTVFNSSRSSPSSAPRCTGSSRPSGHVRARSSRASCCRPSWSRSSPPPSASRRRSCSTPPSPRDRSRSSPHRSDS